MNITREELRLLFLEKVFSYSNIKKEEIAILQSLLKEELSGFENIGFIMKLCTLRTKDICYKDDGTLKHCYFRVKGIITPSKNGVYKAVTHFTEREAISFNTENTNGDFFIGFAGWADSNNVQPFLNAFYKFIIKKTEIK